MNTSSRIDADTKLTAVTASALTFLVWELCITFDDEVEFIWSKPSKSPIKWLFLFTRYVGLGSLAGSRFIGIGGDNPILSCTGFLVLQVTLMQALIILVELILALRVHALYNRDRRMGAFLLFLVVSEPIIAIIWLSSTVPNTEFDSLCNVVHINSRMTSLSFSIVATECILLLLTILKCISTSRTVRKSALIKLMLRDGTLGFLAVFSILIPASVLLDVSHGALVSVTNPWFNAVWSSAGCRLIVNMHRLSLEEQSHIAANSNPTLPMISTHINIEPPNMDTIDEVI
ncbi:hypothetical protein BV22DRAFT_1131619 [Leucogyrophana mollusca]|uniref:Uncharacterized protein n=1 Tax=Leucogyrophana mollusca TaxID=85980 RepID=A0ACB8BA96_9AGAM|nr:hypothetical protein BV22DRAFT_1131619 [Leucogyrophana mollusca]